MASVDMHDIDLKEYQRGSCRLQGRCVYGNARRRPPEPEKQAVPAHRLYQADRGRQHRGGEARSAPTPRTSAGCSELFRQRHVRRRVSRTHYWRARGRGALPSCPNARMRTVFCSLPARHLFMPRSVGQALPFGTVCYNMWYLLQEAISCPGARNGLHGSTYEVQNMSLFEKLFGSVSPRRSSRKSSPSPDRVLALEARVRSCQRPTAASCRAMTPALARAAGRRRNAWTTFCPTPLPPAARQAWARAGHQTLSLCRWWAASCCTARASPR